MLDCPPALDLLTLNALVAADGVLIPMQAEILPLRACRSCSILSSAFASSWNPKLSVDGVVLTMFDERTNLAQQVAEELEDVISAIASVRPPFPEHTISGSPKPWERHWSMTCDRAGRGAIYE